jgi:hypothetical protein
MDQGNQMKIVGLIAVIILGLGLILWQLKRSSQVAIPDAANPATAGATTGSATESGKSIGPAPMDAGEEPPRSGLKLPGGR